METRGESFLIPMASGLFWLKGSVAEGVHCALAPGAYICDSREGGPNL